jgi:cell division protein FtsL
MSAPTRASRAGAPVLPWLARAAAVALVIVAVGVFHVWSRTRVVAAGYALGELQREHVKLTAEHDRLRIVVETLRSPSPLERFARTKLGMDPPAPGAVQAAGP